MDNDLPETRNEQAPKTKSMYGSFIMCWIELGDF